MPTRLRLHQDGDSPPYDRVDGGGGGSTATSMEAPESFPFPLTTVRGRLIAGKVLGDPRTEAPAHGQERQFGHRAVIPFPAQGVQDTDELVGEIERTLARMQDRLDEFRTQLDDTFKFPSPSHRGSGRDDGPSLPPAA